MILVGAYWVEHHFTRPADVVINGLVAYISISMLNNPPNTEWWDILRYASIALAGTAFVIGVAGSPALAQHDTSALKRVAYLLVVRLGSSQVLFSIVFLLSLVSYFDLKTVDTKLMVIAWGIVMLARYLEVGSLVRALLKLARREQPLAIGSVTRLFEPNIVRFDLSEGVACPKGTIVQLSAAGLPEAQGMAAVVFGYRRSTERTEVEAVFLQGGAATTTFGRQNVVTRMEEGTPQFDNLIAVNPRLGERGNLIGIASKNTDVARVYFEIDSSAALEVGQLSVVHVPNGSDLFFQIVNGRLNEEACIDRSERSFTVAEAEQLGRWSEARQGFETHRWVVPENAPVFRAANQVPNVAQADRDRVLVGNIPNSTFPAMLNLRDLVLFHSAILGVTGSGKSFLAYSLIEACAAAGIKVICLDLTGDYRRYLHDAVLLAQGNVAAFLNDPARQIGIIEFGGAPHPIIATKEISEIALQWCRENRKEEEVVEPVAKVLLVLEEAHSLIPEWNANPVQNLQATVNATSTMVLQARKYGLGFMVITQRTANVIKSVLNQCNTLFAFQAFDETGFAFMKNYMGDRYVEAIPSLRRRQGVIVGKSSLSDRPVIVDFSEQARAARNQAPEVYRAPPAQ
jgi:hypothetical protein